jgi:hypothetical protein
MVKTVQISTVTGFQHSHFEQMVTNNSRIRFGIGIYRATAAVAAYHEQFKAQQAFFDGSMTNSSLIVSDAWLIIRGLLDALPNLKHLHYEVRDPFQGKLDYIDFSDTSDLSVYVGAFDAPRPQHWHLLPGAFQIIKHYRLTAFTIDADSSMLGDVPSGSSSSQAEPLPLLDASVIRASAVTLTKIHLITIRLDLYSCGRFQALRNIPLHD